MAVNVYPLTGALKFAAQQQTYLALSVLHLFKATFNLTPTVVAADLEAIEADYDGYEPITCTTWNQPYLDPAGGASMQPGTKQFNFASDTGSVNSIYGWFLESAAGDLLAAGTFDGAIPMVQDGDSVPLNPILNGWNS